MIVTVFRSRIRPDVDQKALAQVGERMHQLATSMPGFVSYKDFTAGDNESVTVVEFESAETLEAWRRHPEHLEAQRQGRETFFLEYSIQVCRPLRSYGFDRTRGRWENPA